MHRKSLTDRQKAALTALELATGPVHPSYIARLLDGPGESGAGWSSTLRSMVGLNLVRADYTLHGMQRFEITEAGREAMRS